jgi:hypothetical protein
VIFFYGFFELSLPRNAQKRDKKNRTKQPREKKRKKTEEKNPAFFVMSPGGLFRGKKIVFLNSPCYETPKKRLKNKSIKIILSKKIVPTYPI